MENKTTSELLDLLFKYEKQSDKHNDFDWDKYDEVIGELRNREPFKQIIGESLQSDEGTLTEKVAELIDDVKLLKRHRHDEKNGDVLIRI